MRISWKHIRETIAAAQKRLSESDPISTGTDNALAIALKVARHKAGQLRTAALKAGQQELPPGEDAMLTPAQAERIRAYADNQVAYYEKIRMGNGNSAPSADPSPMEGAYKAIADPNAYEAELEARILAKHGITPAGQPQGQAKPRAPVPKSLASTTSAQPRDESGKFAASRASLEDILG